MSKGIKIVSFNTNDEGKITNAFEDGRGKHTDETVNNLSPKELVDVYNANSEKQVSRFESKAKGVARLWALVDAGVAAGTIKLGGGKAKTEKAAKQPRAKKEKAERTGPVERGPGKKPRYDFRIEDHIQTMYNRHAARVEKGETDPKDLRPKFIAELIEKGVVENTARIRVSKFFVDNGMRAR